MAFEYPQVIYFDITDDDSDISLEQSDSSSRKEDAYNITQRGSSGVVYVNSSLPLCIKLIVYPVLNDDNITEELTRRYENEARLQSTSSEVGFAPTIHRHFHTQITINGTQYDVYVIVMDYLNPSEWRNILPNELTQAMIESFVKTTGLYNDVDPYNHFYQKINGEDIGKIVMIDYGNVKKCIDQKPKLTVNSCILNILVKIHTRRHQTLASKKNSSV